MAVARMMRNPQGPMVLLSGAICEWFLIFLLFLDATFWYILRKFAEYCELPIPCLFCSRMDGTSGKRNFKCYNALLCKSHREEISSLVTCKVHGNITDVREMCEECFMPTSMHDKLNPGSYMAGKLIWEIEQHSVQRSVLHKKILPAFSGPRICPCCNKSWGAKPNAQRFLQSSPIGLGASSANVKPPLPRPQSRSRFSRRNSFQKPRNRFSAPATPRSHVKSKSDSLSHVGYTELKFTSESESDAPRSDEEGRNYMNSEHGPARTLLKLQTNDTVLEKQSDQTIADVISLLDQHMQLETHKSMHGLEDLNWDQLHPRTSIPITPELNSFDYATQAPSNVSGDASISVKPQPCMLAELISSKNTPPSSDDKNQETLISHDEDDMSLYREPVNETCSEDGGVPYILNDISSSSSSGMSNEGKEVSTTSFDLPSTSASTNATCDEDGGVPYILNDISSSSSSAMTNEGKEVSTTSVDLPSISASTKFEDIKSVQESASKQDDSQKEVSTTHVELPGVPYILNEISSTCSSAMTTEGKELSTTSVDLPSTSVYPKFEDIKSVQQYASKQGDSLKEGSTTSVEVPFASGSTNFEDIKSDLQQSSPKQDDSQNIGGSTSYGNHAQALASLERNDSGLRFADIVGLSDVEGESSVDILKSRIEYDKKCMNDLYKELEEERNASAIAANQAMAMITRLQEEKAALHMEALQYLRMMDEQAQYDMEALQKANDQLAEKEKELQDLEYELEVYQNDIDGGFPVPNPHKENVSPVRENTNGDPSVHHNGSSVSEPGSPVTSKMGISDDISGKTKSPMSNLEEEKLYLVKYLKQLERRIHEVSCTKPCECLNSSGHHLTNDQVDSEKEADGSLAQNGFSVVDGASFKDSSTHLLEDHDVCCEDANHNRSNWKILSTSGREPNMETFEIEIVNFKERLKTFEGDWEFVKYSLSAFHNGNDGLKYIQQIIDMLQELRTIEFKKRCLSIP